MNRTTSACIDHNGRSPQTNHQPVRHAWRNDQIRRRG
jgi:hypothetical protein